MWCKTRHLSHHLVCSPGAAITPIISRNFTFSKWSSVPRKPQLPTPSPEPQVSSSPFYEFELRSLWRLRFSQRPAPRLASLVAQRVKHLSTMRETQVRSLGWEYSLEKAMAPHSSILAWRIPWTEKPGRLQFMGSQRVGHDWATSLSLSSSLSSLFSLSPTSYLSSFLHTFP